MHSNWVGQFFSTSFLHPYLSYSGCMNCQKRGERLWQHRNVLLYGHWLLFWLLWQHWNVLLYDHRLLFPLAAAAAGGGRDKCVVHMERWPEWIYLLPKVFMFFSTCFSCKYFIVFRRSSNSLGKDIQYFPWCFFLFLVWRKIDISLPVGVSTLACHNITTRIIYVISLVDVVSWG